VDMREKHHPGTLSCEIVNRVEHLFWSLDSAIFIRFTKWKYLMFASLVFTCRSKY